MCGLNLVRPFVTVEDLSAFLTQDIAVAELSYPADVVYSISELPDPLILFFYEFLQACEWATKYFTPLVSIFVSFLSCQEIAWSLTQIAPFFSLETRAVGRTSGGRSGKAGCF
jgi:hypothetical protein